MAEKVRHRLEAKKKRGYQLQAEVVGDETCAALRCKRGDLRIALDATRRAVCMHHPTQGPMRVNSARLRVIDLKELDEMIASDRYSIRYALALIPEHAWAITPIHSSIELDWVRSVRP